MPATGKKSISVIIPTWNEERALPVTLARIFLGPGDELIVVDGGSTDATVEIAKKFTRNVFVTAKGRGGQLRFGAEKASHGILLFLHADCILPDGALEMVRETLEDETVALGAFRLGIGHPSFCFRIIEFGANLRSVFAGMPYGDQAFFMRRDVYEKAGGFADMPIMEDVEMVGRLRRLGRVRILQCSVNASPRRWLSRGLLRTTLTDWRLAVSYGLLRRRLDDLAAEYGDVR